MVTRYDQRPYLVNRKTLLFKFVSPKLVARMIAADWFVVVRKGKPGCEALYDYESVEKAYERYKGGEEPPLLPCERRQRRVKQESDKHRFRKGIRGGRILGDSTAPA